MVHSRFRPGCRNDESRNRGEGEGSVGVDPRERNVGHS